MCLPAIIEQQYYDCLRVTLSQHAHCHCACAKGAGFAMYVVLFIDFLVRLYIVVLYTYETRSGRFRRIMMNSVTR